MTSHPLETDRFRLYLAEKKLRWTSQRSGLLKAFLDLKGHVTAEDLHRHTASGREMGFATVYRTLKHLVECGLAREVDWGDGKRHFEPHQAGKHHDHLLCVECGKVVEFLQPKIESLQENVGRHYGFEITDHRFLLFGRCPRCRHQSGSKTEKRTRPSARRAPGGEK